MGSGAKTADERYIISAYQMANDKGDRQAQLNKYEVGQRVGIHPKGVDAISKLLIRSNFIKRVTDSDTDIYLTKNGEQLAERLLQE